MGFSLQCKYCSKPFCECVFRNFHKFSSSLIYKSLSFRGIFIRFLARYFRLRTLLEPGKSWRPLLLCGQGWIGQQNIPWYTYRQHTCKMKCKIVQSAKYLLKNNIAKQKWQARVGKVAVSDSVLGYSFVQATVYHEKSIYPFPLSL